MKLFSVKTLSTVTMLSTTILLSACWSCGGSDSSGSDNNTAKTDAPKIKQADIVKAESNSSGSQKEQDKKKEQSKKDDYSLIGYWKSECITEDIASPTIVYYHITETKNNEPKKAVEVVQEFKGKNCTGTSEVSYRDASDWGADEEDKLSVKFSDKDHWQLMQTDSINKKVMKTDFTRSSVDEFNKIKNQGKKDELAKEKAIQDKADMLKGYWLSGCTNLESSEYNKDGSSNRHYIKITEKNNKFIIDKKYENFERHGCNPKEVFSIIFEKKPQIFDLKRIAELPKEIISNDKWRDYGDTYTRISENTYNDLKEYDKYPQFK